MLRNDSREKILDSKPRRCFFIQTAFGTGFTCLTSGMFLSGLAILMGAGDVLVSYLSVIINICGVLILAFAGFMERFHSRKRLTIALTALSRLATLLIVIIPALVPRAFQVALFVPIVIVAFTLQAQATVVLNQWMMGFVDEKKSGRYISLRQTMTIIVTVILSIVGGCVVDLTDKGYIGFALLFTAAAVLGAGELALLARTPDGAEYQSSNQACRLRDIIRLPFKNRCFIDFVVYIMLFYMLLYISDSFTMVYMQRYLELPYQSITAMTMIINLPQIILVGIWGKISDKLGHDFVLKASIWFFAVETLLMFFVDSQSWFLFIPLAFLMSSIANSGFIIAVFNRRYELMPEENRIVYDNFYTAAIGLGFIIGPMVGGIIKSRLEVSAAITNALPFAGIRLLYPISTAGILLLQIYYLYSQKKRRSLPG